MYKITYGEDVIKYIEGDTCYTDGTTFFIIDSNEKVNFAVLLPHFRTVIKISKEEYDKIIEPEK